MSEFDINGKLLKRKNKNFFAKVGVSTTTFIPDQRVQWSFNSVGLALLVESNNANHIIEYSFDGINVHGDLSPGLPSGGIIFDNRFENNIWLRRASNIGAGTVIVRIEAWRHDA